VVADILMPGMNGYELCRRLRADPGTTLLPDRADPDEVLELLRNYHVTLGRTVDEFGGTLEHFAGDGMMIFFNDPFPIDRPAWASAWRRATPRWT
jgi:class 3 adenylate cyclase